jgi:hypothetical protein
LVLSGTSPGAEYTYYRLCQKYHHGRWSLLLTIREKTFAHPK